MLTNKVTLHNYPFPRAIKHHKNPSHFHGAIYSGLIVKGSTMIYMLEIDRFQFTFQSCKKNF